MTDYQSNSHKSREAGKDKEKKDLPEKKIEKVVTGDVVIKKPGLRHKFRNVFLGGDVKTAIAYVIGETVMPAIRNMLSDSIKGATDRMIYGTDTYRTNRRSGYNPHVNYSRPANPLAPIMRDPRMSSGRLPDQPPLPMSHDSQPGGDIYFQTREEALMVLETMNEVVDQYDAVTLADLYEMCGMSSSYTDNKQGWTFVKNGEVRHTRNGWVLNLPPLEIL